MNKILDEYNQKIKAVSDAKSELEGCEFKDPEVQKLANLVLAISDAITPDVKAEDLARDFVASILGR